MVGDGWLNGSNGLSPRQVDQKQLNRAIHWMFVRNEPNKLTDDATKACKALSVKPDDLVPKTFEDFKQDGSKTVKDEIADVRFEHYQNKRISNILKVFDYMLAEGLVKIGRAG